jgi:hypothetical protein
MVTALLATVGASLVLALGGEAKAAPPATAGVIQLGVGFRYGHELQQGDFNPWGPGIGIAGGYTLPQAIYLGGSLEYFFGDQAEVDDFSTSANYVEAQAEGGYDVGVSARWVIRPKVGAGVAVLQSETCVDTDCTSEGDTAFVLAPGASVMFLSPSFSLSLDARYDMVFGEEEMVNAIVWSVGFGF